MCEDNVVPIEKMDIKLIFVTEGFKDVSHFIFKPEMLYYAAELGRGLGMSFVIDDYYFRRLDGVNGNGLPEITVTNGNLFTREAVDIVRKNFRME